MSSLLELAERAKVKPPFFSLCRWGVHRDAQLDQYITTGYAVCVECGLVSMTSLFGEFPMSREESAEIIRSRAASCDTQPKAGDVEQAPLVSGAVTNEVRQTPTPSDLSTDKDG